MYKFRTMKKDSHKLRNTLTKMNKSDGPLFKIEHDPRILKGLHFVRKFSLDDKDKIRMPTRKKNSLLGIRELATDRHLSLDLEGYPNGLVNEKNQFTRIKMFEKREEDNPVLILYLLDPLFENNDYPFYQDIEVPPPEIIPAPVIVLPDKKLDDESLEELIAYYRLECLPGSGR